MNEQKTLSGFYEQDHDRPDELFRTFQKLKRADFAKAKESFKEFKFGLQRHIVREEDVLFLIWEEKTGMSEGGPTSVIRAEHRRIGRQLGAVHGNVADQNPDSDQEEREFYPAIDQLTSAEERETVFRSMKNSPEERYKLCCGRH
ncbi:MAG TPA: hemerythrin domain-containing protein [Nitrospiraceae bacterium]|nr:hemerythrin domain-containing protein [Nitrospiraceae bacterium]